MTYAGDLAERWRRDRELVLTELDVWETFWEERLRKEVGAEEEARDALDALQAVAEARSDLDAQVVARMALELMLLRFPAVTLAAEGAPAPSRNENES